MKITKNRKKKSKRKNRKKQKKKKKVHFLQTTHMATLSFRGANLKKKPKTATTMSQPFEFLSSS